MRLPSIEQVIEEARRSATRFPFVLACAIIATLSALVLTDREGGTRQSAFFGVLMAAGLGFPLLLATSLTMEQKRLSKGMAVGIQLLGAVLLALYAYSIPSDLPIAPASYLSRFAILFVGLLFLVMYLPFAAKTGTNGFWHYNVAMFLRILTSILFAGVLFVGLAIALAALQNLFGLNIEGKRYFELWILIGGLFATWFFLAGVPKDLDALESAEDYPKGLRVFAQYVLFSLVIVYLVILYAYLAKILVQWNWPKGWVAELILGFTVTGIVSIVLLYPLRDRAGSTWVRTAWRWYFIVLIPLVIVLFLAINQRISDYGFTVERYFVVVLGIWLALMIAYFSLSRTKSITAIPLSLCLFSLATCAGPWGAFGISERSQIGRLSDLLARNEILVDGKIRTTTGTVPFEDRKQISSIVSYLRSNHGLQSIQPWFEKSLRADSTTWSRYVEVEEITKMMGFKFVTPWLSRADMASWITADQTTSLNISGYDWYVRSVSLMESDSGTTRTHGDLACRASKALDTLYVAALVNDVKVDSLSFCLIPILDSVSSYLGIGGSYEPVPRDKVSLTGVGPRLKAKLCFTGLHVEQKDSVRTIKGFTADIVYSIKEQK